MIKFISISVVITSMILVGTVQAQVSLVDDPIFGPESVIRDEVHNTEYLNLEETFNITYSDILIELEPGGDFEGWRVASVADLEDLGFAAGIEHSSEDPEVIANAEQLRDWFGQVRTSSTHIYCRGLVSDIRTDLPPPLPPLAQLAFSIGRYTLPSPNSSDFRVSGWAGLDWMQESTYLVREATEPDADGDGIPDIDDCEPDSDLSATIFIDGCDTGVANELFDDGCTMADLIADAAAAAKNHGQFVSSVAQLANEWRKAGLISGSDKGAIQSCAAGSSLP